MSPFRGSMASIARAVRRSLVLIVLLAVRPAAARAGGINLAWDDCGTFGTAAKTAACNTNAGGSTMVVSVVPDHPMTLTGADLLIQASTSRDILPPWWDFRL